MGLFQCPVKEAIDDTNQMLDETLALITANYPEINLDAPKRQSLKARKALDKVIIFEPVE